MKQADIQIESVIIRYLSGTATQDEIEKLILWIESDPDNRDYFMQMKNLWEVSSPVFDPEAIDPEGAFEKIRKKLEQPDHRRTNWIRYWQQIAAVLIIPLFAFSFYLYFKSNLSNDLISYQEILAPYGTRSFVNLPDGSNVWLNAGSSIKYPVRFKKGERNVFLKGEAYFEIESDLKNPFLVQTERIKVRATGTAFNVEAYDYDSIASVTLVKGVVDVSVPQQKMAIALKPGERMNYNNITDQYDKMQTSTYKWYAWKDGKLIFRDDSLEYVLKRISQTFNIDIRLMDKSLANHLYRATFEDESLDEILRLLKMTAPIAYKESKRNPTDASDYQRRKIEVYKIK